MSSDTYRRPESLICGSKSTKNPRKGMIQRPKIMMNKIILYVIIYIDWVLYGKNGGYFSDLPWSFNANLWGAVRIQRRREIWTRFHCERTRIQLEKHGEKTGFTSKNGGYFWDFFNWKELYFEKEKFRLKNQTILYVKKRAFFSRS